MIIIKFLKPYLNNYRFKLLCYYMASILFACTSLLTPFITGKYIDSLIYAKTNNTKYIMYFLILIIVSFVLKYIKDTLMNSMANCLSFDIEYSVFKHIRHVSLKNISTSNPAYLTSKVNNGSFFIPSFVLYHVTELVISIISLIVTLCLLFIINPYISSFIILFLIANIIISKLFKKPLNKSNYKLQENQNCFFGLLNNQIMNIKLIKINSWFEEFAAESKDFFPTLFRSFMHNARLNVLFNALTILIKNLALLLILIISVISILNNHLSIGDFQIIYAYSLFCYACINTIMNFTPEYQRTLSFYSRIKEVIDLKEEHNGNIQLNTFDSLNISNLSFSYKDDSFEYILKNLSISFEKGKVYQLKGKNGCGKSTFVDLLLGLYYDFDGSIRYDNYEITTLDMYKLRKDLVFKVEQEPALINSSIENNIVLVLDTYDKNYLNSLLDMFSLPNKNTIIDNNSSNISGGQKQKISLIRSFLRSYNSEGLLILDEPTSALDVQSIATLKKLLSRTKKDKITLIITHDDTFNDISDFTIDISLLSSNCTTRSNLM